MEYLDLAIKTNFFFVLGIRKNSTGKGWKSSRVLLWRSSACKSFETKMSTLWIFICKGELLVSKSLICVKNCNENPCRNIAILPGTFAHKSLRG